MLKFVILSVLAVGCYSQAIQSRPQTFSSYSSYGSGSSGGSLGSYGSGGSLGGGLSSGRSQSFSYGSGGSYGLGGGLGGGIGYVSGAGLGGAGLIGGGARLVAIQAQPIAVQAQPIAVQAAQPIAIQAAAPVATSYVAQPISTGLVYGGQTQFAAAAPAVSSVSTVSTGAAAARPAVSYLTQHAGEPHQAVVSAAIQQLGRTVEYKALPYQDQPINPQVVEVEPSEVPLHVHFKTKSSSVSLSQSHEQRPAEEAQLSQSQDEPSRLIHEIQKPIIQEVREVITPYRQVTQEINPVVEAVHTVVTKAEGQRQQYVAQQYKPAVSAVAAQPLSVSYEQKVVAQPAVSAVAAPVATAAVQPIAFQTVAAQPVATSFQTIAAQPAAASFQTIAAQPAAASFQTIAAQPIAFQTVAAQPAASYAYTTGLVPAGGISTGTGYGFESSRFVSQPVSTSSSFVSSSQPISYSTASRTTGASNIGGAAGGNLESRVFSALDSARVQQK